MTKWKSIVALLLSLTVIGLCALLPKLSDVLLQADEAKILSTDMKTPPLTIKEDEPLSVTEKLSLLATNQMITPSERPTVMTADEATQAAYQCLAPYRDQGLIAEDYQDWTVNHITPLLYFRFAEDSEKTVTNLFWDITLISPNSASIEVLVDDETGLLFAIYTFTNDGTPFTRADLIPFVESITTTFFKPLGLTPDLVDYAKNTEVTENEAANSSVEYSYYLPDPDQGTIHIVAQAAEYGFSVYSFFEK